MDEELAHAKSLGLDGRTLTTEVEGGLLLPKILRKGTNGVKVTQFGTRRVYVQDKLTSPICIA